MIKTRCALDRVAPDYNHTFSLSGVYCLSEEKMNWRIIMRRDLEEAITTQDKRQRLYYCLPKDDCFGGIIM